VKEREGGWNVESPHILDGSFRANTNGCRVSWGKNGQCSGGEETRTRGLKEGRDGEERVREGKVKGRPKRDGRRGK
jgi:hypothetical protein